MTAGIRLGDIKVLDQNQNDLYDSEVDLVTDLQGHPLIPSEKSLKLNKVLQSLKAPGWKGILLSVAGDYLENAEKAQRDAKEGNIDWVRYHLQKAVDGSRKLGLSFDQTWGDSIFKEALEKGIPSLIRQVAETASSGRNIDEVKIRLDDAEQYDADYQYYYRAPSLLDKNKTDQILKTAYERGIPELQIEAVQSALEGNLGYTQFLIQKIQSHIQEANRLYPMSLPYDPDLGDACLKLAYLNEIANFYEWAEKQAQKGMTRNVRSFFNHIHNEIGEANQRYRLRLTFNQERADRIWEIALMNGIEDNYQVAEKKAKAGDFAKAQYWLDQTKQYIQEYNYKYASLPGRQHLFFDYSRAQIILSYARFYSAYPPPPDLLRKK